MEIGKRYKIIAFFLSLSLSLFGELGVKHLPSHHDNTGCPPLPSHLPARLGFRTRYLTASLLLSFLISTPSLLLSISSLVSTGERVTGATRGGQMHSRQRGKSLGFKGIWIWAPVTTKPSTPFVTWDRLDHSELLFSHL